MAVKFNKIVSAGDIPKDSWDSWLLIENENPVDYLRKTYGATEVPKHLRTQQVWREIRFRSRKLYTEFYLTWM